ncbi:nucleotidyltransferase family protein [Pseudochrobactrum sp. MP213Fo]|uniref:nucleotidyltransferase family protein n=1 Tax=Pseudochrobactrum sp. MP213Fo TaxID=3022250 RepID=UPI003BA248F6
MIDASTVAVLVLGAGEGSRYADGDKLGVMLNGLPVAHHVLNMLQGFRWGAKILTCRTQSSEQTTWIQGYARQGFEIAVVEEPETGMLGSLHRGLRAVKDQSHVLICLADMPLVPAVHIERLLAAHHRIKAPVIASRSQTYRGPPALCVPDYLRTLPENGEGGARSLLTEAGFVEMDDPAFCDIDTVHDFEKVRQILQSNSG